MKNSVTFIYFFRIILKKTMLKTYSAIARFNSIKDEVLFVTSDQKVLEKWVTKANNIIKQYRYFGSDEIKLNEKSFSYKLFYLYEIDSIDMQETEVKVLKRE